MYIRYQQILNYLQTSQSTVLVLLVFPLVQVQVYETAPCVEVWHIAGVLMKDLRSSWARPKYNNRFQSNYKLWGGKTPTPFSQCLTCV